jgi:GNAT superfamily N-acetyltransferase
MTSGAAVRFAVASPGQLPDVLAVLDEAAAWLRERGVEQWPARFDPSWVEGAVRRGETWLAVAGGTAAGTVTLDLADPVWDEAPAADALYVHRMAVRRAAAGLGAVILDWAAGVAREQGRAALRLDCVASNRRLRGYYEAAGFAHRGDATVRGAPGQRLDDGPVTVVSRYERRLAP